MEPPAKNQSLPFGIELRTRRPFSEMGWGEVGLAMLDIRAQSDWKATGASFSRYINALARHEQVQASTLWRCMAAVETYSILREKYADLKLPEILEFQRNSYAEHVEIIGKLARVAPEAEVRRWILQAVQGTLTRKALREAWNIYQTATSMPHRRGRRPAGAAPEITRPHIDEHQLLEAEALHAIIKSSPNWLGTAPPLIYREFVSPAPFIPFPYDLSEELSLDLVAVTRPDLDAVYDLHGLFVLVGDHRANYRLADMPKFFPYVDFLWFANAAIPSDPLRDAVEFEQNVPADLGYLIVRGDAVETVRSPTRCRSRHRRVDQLCAHLLASKGN